MGVSETENRETGVEPPANEAFPLALSVGEAAKLLGVSRGLLYDLVARGRIRSVKLGRRVVVPRQAVVEILSGPASGSAMGKEVESGDG